MTNTNLLRVMCAVTVLGAGLVPVAAQAANVSASTNVWSVTPTNLLLSNNQYLADAAIPQQSQFEVGSTLPAITLNNTQGGNTSYASVGSQWGGDEPATTAAAINLGSGSATAQWSFDWTAQSTGQAMLDVEYEYNIFVGSLGAGESALASSSISLFRDGSPQVYEALRFFNMTEGEQNGVAHLLLAPFDVLAGQTGTFTLTLTSNARANPVPLPAGLPLLASALAGLGALARRRRQIA